MKHSLWRIVGCASCVLLPVSAAPIEIGHLGAGVTANEDATGPGYILYNPNGLGAARPHYHPNGGVEQSRNFIAVFRKNDAWFYYKNEDDIAFEPRIGDVLVATVDFTGDTSSSLIGKRFAVHGIFAGYKAGDLLITPERYNGEGNDDEFELEGTEIELYNDPHWWLEKEVILSGVTEVDHLSPANLGQAKHMVRSAVETIEGANGALADLIKADLQGDPATAPFSAWPPPAAGESDRSPLLIGQLKAISAPIYTHLNAAVPVWLDNEMQLKGTRQSGTHLPWSASVGASNNRGVANLGQLKAVFSLPFEALNPDSDNDGYNDAWELTYYNSLGSIGVANQGDDDDQDGITTLQEAQVNSDPTVDEATQSSKRMNYTYTAVGRIDAMTGAGSRSYSFDDEGNMKSAH